MFAEVFVRKTGITVKDPGVRDEHGLEPLDDLFSSPEKPQPAHNEIYEAGEADVETGGDEDLDESRYSFISLFLFVPNYLQSDQKPNAR